MYAKSLLSERCGLLIYTLIITLRDLKNNPHIKTKREYYLLIQFQILEISNSSKLIKKLDENQQICSYENLFEQIAIADYSVGHGGIKKTNIECSKNFDNIHLVFLYQFLISVA